MARLGSFIREFEIEGTIFHVRGLTVGEFTDMRILHDMEKSAVINQTLYLKIAEVGIVGWEALMIDDEVVEEYDYEIVRLMIATLPDVMMKVGSYIYHNLSFLEEDEDQKYRGYIRFLHWASDEKNKHDRQYFDCKKCITANRYISKKCSLDPIQFKAIAHSAGKEVELIEAQPMSKKLDKMKGRFKRRRKYAKEEPTEERSLELLGFKFPACPVSWIDPHIKVIADKMDYCHKNGVTFFDGGLGDQPQKLYEIGQAVASEANKIEFERIENEKKNSKIKSKKRGR